jgi:hypothetical protein
VPRKSLKAVLIALAAIGGGIQFIQPERTNPSANPGASFEAAAKPSPAAAAVIRRACADCHSHDTKWPWYSGVSPMSWLVANDVRDGRARLNLSEWNLYGPEMSALRAGEMCDKATKGEMPLWQYTFLHREARLSGSDIAALCTITP